MIIHKRNNNDNCFRIYVYTMHIVHNIQCIQYSRYSWIQHISPIIEEYFHSKRALGKSKAHIPFCLNLFGSIESLCVLLCSIIRWSNSHYNHATHNTQHIPLPKYLKVCNRKQESPKIKRRIFSKRSSIVQITYSGIHAYHQVKCFLFFLYSYFFRYP